MSLGIDSLGNILKNEHHRTILLLLYEKNSLSYTDLMSDLGIDDAEKLNSRLKALGDLVINVEDGQYALSEKGILAAKLMLAFPKCPLDRRASAMHQPQMFWWGVITCFLTIYLLYLVFPRITPNQFLGNYFLANLGLHMPVLFPIFLFLAIGAYMVASDLHNVMKPRHEPKKFTKKKAVIIALVIAVGFLLVGLANSSLTNDEKLTQIDHQTITEGNNNYLINLTRQTWVQVDLTVQPGDYGHKYNLNISKIFWNRQFQGQGGTVNSSPISVFFIADATDQYKIEWTNIHVTDATAYHVEKISPQVPNYAFSGAGVSVLIFAVFAVLGLGRAQLFGIRKTGVFWWGLIIWGFALSGLFATLWLGIVMNNSYFSGGIYATAETAASIVFLALGFLMMKYSTHRDHLTYSAEALCLQPVPRKLKFDFSQRNHRGLIYLLASVIFNMFTFTANPMMPSINFVGFLLGLPFTWFYPLPSIIFPLYVVGFFIEIFAVCEFLIYTEHKLEKITS